MFKFVVFSVLLTIAQADLDKFYGNAVLVGMSPNTTKYGPGCDWYTISEVKGTKCTCGERTNFPLLSFKLVAETSNDKKFAATEVKTFEEVDEALKIKKCTCGDNEHLFMAFKEINDNYYIIYSAPRTPNTTRMAFLNIKTTTTQAEFDKTISNIPDMKNRTNYAAFCGLH